MITSEQLDIKSRMLQKIEMSGLTEEDAEFLRFEAFDRDVVLKKLPGIPVAKHGFQIPYFDVDGEPTGFWRYRLLENLYTGFAALTAKGMKYCQPPKSINELYLSPMLDWRKIADDTQQTLIITEGELKAACACKLGLPTIGLGGVWCFKAGGRHMPMLPQFGQFAWSGRHVYIIYDSDALGNSLVLSAENALAKLLTELGAIPHAVRLPTLAPPSKTGLDDFLVSEGTQPLLDLIEQTPEWRAALELHSLNEEVVYVKDPGLILRLSNLQRMQPRAFTDHAFAPLVFYEEVPTSKGTRLVEKSAAKEWLKWPQRSTVERITYQPGSERVTRQGELNIWPGWSVTPVEGDVTPWITLLDYMFRAALPEHRRWFEQWIAYPLQHPGHKMFTAVVVWGTTHGTGKSLIGYTLSRIYGKNATEIGDADLGSTHNEWAENKQFVMADEIVGGDKRHMADRIKSMITQKLIRLNPKYVPSYTVPDCINYYFTSNHPDAFFLEDSDRRFFIHEFVGPPMPMEFYRAYESWMNGRGASALFYHLLNIDTSDFMPQAPAPTTESKLEMIDNGKGDLASWVSSLKRTPQLVLKLGEKPLNRVFWTTNELFALYDADRSGKVTANGLARELRKAGIPRAVSGKLVNTEHGYQRLWILKDPEVYIQWSEPRVVELFHKERGGGRVGKF